MGVIGRRAKWSGDRACHGRGEVSSSYRGDEASNVIGRG